MMRPQDSLEAGPLHVELYRTLRVPAKEGVVSNLPAGLGSFGVYPVRDFPQLPEGWDRNGHFVVIHPQEALFMGLYASSPVAVMVGAGTRNAVSGDLFKHILGRGEQDYLVVPPQMWLDGFKGTGGVVYQFVGKRLGQGKTVGEQLGGSLVSGAIQIGMHLPKVPLPDIAGPATRLMCAAAECVAESPEMGLAAGGAITQKIYPDPYLDGRVAHDVWHAESEPGNRSVIYLLNAGQCLALTGMEPPPSPITREQYERYNIPWFGMDDGSWGDVSGSSAFDKIRDLEE